MVPAKIESSVDLKEAVKARLMQTPVWRDVQSKLRAEIFKVRTSDLLAPYSYSAAVYSIVD